jgi:hypothetical protein
MRGAWRPQAAKRPLDGRVRRQCDTGGHLPEADRTIGLVVLTCDRACFCLKVKSSVPGDLLPSDRVQGWPQDDECHDYKENEQVNGMR